MNAVMRTESSAATTPVTRCVVCGSATRPAISGWTFRCGMCGTWSSTLQPAINQATPEVIDHEARVAGLRELRRENFSVVLDRIEATIGLEGKRLLDVGCSDGWFLQDAEARGAETLGLEPDEAIALHAQEPGLNVRMGRFPEALDPTERFDIITFNDVLEHLPDVRAALTACHAHLTDGGLLSVNIPTSDGLGYRAATLLARIGVRRPYGRFWQADLPSPHTYYFPRTALRRLVQDSGFVVSGQGPLTSISATGLWQRVHVLGRPSLWSVGAYAGLRMLSPVLNSPMASDITHLMATRPPRPGAPAGGMPRVQRRASTPTAGS